MARNGRRGMTLPELLVGLVILAILGAAMVRLVIWESRGVDRLVQQRSARAVTRSSVNLLLSELRMVIPDGGVISASSSSIELFVPYALGLACATVGQATALSLLPADPEVLAGSTFGGYAWRGHDGRYSFVDSAVSLGAPLAGTCAGARVTTVPGGREVALSPPLPAGATSGTPVFLVQRLRYWFGPSSDVPGSVALLRTDPATGTTEELASPLDSTSHFRFFATGSDVSLASPPAPATLRGLELVLTGMSMRPRQGATGAERATQRTSVFFTNAGTS